MKTGSRIDKWSVFMQSKASFQIQVALLFSLWKFQSPCSSKEKIIQFRVSKQFCNTLKRSRFWIDCKRKCSLQNPFHSWNLIRIFKPKITSSVPKVCAILSKFRHVVFSSWKINAKRNESSIFSHLNTDSRYLSLNSNLRWDLFAARYIFYEIVFFPNFQLFLLQNGTPLWDDLISKATKLQTCLRYVYLNIERISPQYPCTLHSTCDNKQGLI